MSRKNKMKSKFIMSDNNNKIYSDVSENFENRPIDIVEKINKDGTEKVSLNQNIVVYSITCGISEVEKQDNYIQEALRNGHKYIESLIITGGEIVLRFKKELM